MPRPPDGDVGFHAIKA